MAPRITAWVPERADMDWGDAVNLAADWLDEVREDNDGTPVLVTNTADSGGSVSELNALRYRDRWQHTTARSKGRPRGPVLSYVPSAPDLEYAMDLAHGCPLVAVEATGFPLRGWAQELEAVNLLDPDTVVEPVPDEARVLLERLDFYGNNAWGDPFGKRSATQILPELRRFGLLDEALPGRAIAWGRGERGAKALEKLAAQPRRGR